MFTVENNKIIPNKGISLYPSLPDFEIITQGVYNILSNCNPYKSPGPDCIHPYALKAMGTEVSPLLTHIFQQFVTIDDIAKAVDGKLQVDTAILDCSKAFDKVAHSRLLYKLDYYGIRGNLHSWLSLFLYDRSQQVVVDGAKSSIYKAISGGSQGSILGTILFLVYINDITINIHSEIRLFADDILLYRTIKTLNDHHILQEDLNTLTKWADDWMMEFNIPKYADNNAPQQKYFYIQDVQHIIKLSDRARIS